MAKKKSQDLNASDAIKHINSLKTVEAVNEFVSDEVETKNRKTVLGAAIERNQELQESGSEGGNSEEPTSNRPNIGGDKDAGTEAQPKAEEPAAEKPKAEQPAAEETAKEEEPTADVKANKANIASSTDVDNSSKSKPKRIKPLAEITTMAYRQQWTKDNLFNMIKETYPNEEVRMEEFNNRQVAFYVSGDRVPEEGYFSVSTAF
jgi:hypothetical protein